MIYYTGSFIQDSRGFFTQLSRNPNLKIYQKFKFLELRKMYGSNPSTDDEERTAFRKAEKKYKLYYDNARKKKQPRPVDLSEVIDFKSISESYHRNGELPSGIFAIQCESDSLVFCLESHPGFYFISGALTGEEQSRWIKESLTSFPQPPNRTNHNAIYGPLKDLFAAAKDNKALTQEDKHCGTNNSELEIIQNDINVPKWNFSDQSGALSREVTCKSVPASVLLRKLRWSTLGLQFDWSKRNYNISLPHNKIPDALCLLAERMAAAALPSGEVFQAEAAIVNYFGLGDTLGGHVDDMEKDWSKPIVSMSLACKGIFLIGGKSRDIPPVAMFVRSGDVILMAGQARECFHGVPRIFTDKEHADISSLELQFSDEDDSAFLEYIRTSRININIRQVF